MAKLSLNKSALQKERNLLSLYQRVLPSLDLKRLQLMMELAKAKKVLVKDQQEIEKLQDLAGNTIPMLAIAEIDLSGLVKIQEVSTELENVVGVKLPVLKDVHFDLLDYSMLGKPHWVDVLVERLKEAAWMHERLKVSEKRFDVLEHAVRKITQRVNLFEKVLIPKTRSNIKKIKIFLGDAERAAVVRSKIAKKKHGRSPAGEVYV
jgi:V/A-type H+-transporting ATPase subunit D